MPRFTPEEDIKKIREMAARGIPKDDIAKQLGLHVNTVTIYSNDESLAKYYERERRKKEKRDADPDYTRRKREWQRKWEARKRQQPREGDPPPHQAIKTAVPILQELFRYMWKHRIKQRDIAEKVKIGENSLKVWKKGKAEPTLANLEALCDGLGFKLALVPKEPRE